MASRNRTGAVAMRISRTARRGAEMSRVLKRWSVVLPAAVAILAGCGGSGGAPNNQVTHQLTQAAYVTDQEPGFDFLMTVTLRGGGQSGGFTAHGAINSHRQEGTITETIQNQTLLSLIKRPYIYVRIPNTPNAPVQTPWARANLDAVSGQSFGLSLGAGSTDPTQTLALLGASGHVVNVGTQQVNGVSTTHYHAAVDLGRLASVVPAAQRAAAQRTAQVVKRVSGSTTLPMDVWVDAHQLVRRLGVQIGLCTPNGRATESVVFDILRFVNPPSVSLPPPRQVTDITQRLAAQSAQALQSLKC